MKMSTELFQYTLLPSHDGYFRLCNFLPCILILLPPTAYHRHTLEQTRLYMYCIRIVAVYGFQMFVTLMMAVGYNALPPHAILTHWLV